MSVHVDRLIEVFMAGAARGNNRASC